MDSVERNVTLPTDPEETWSLITDPDELNEWLGDDVTFAAEPGSTGEVTDADGVRRRLVVDEAEHGSRLAWHWWTCGNDRDNDDGAGALDVVSRVELTLTPVVAGTRVDVVERRACASLRLLDLELLALCRVTCVVG